MQTIFILLGLFLFSLNVLAECVKPVVPITLSIDAGKRSSDANKISITYPDIVVMDKERRITKSNIVKHYEIQDDDGLLAAYLTVKKINRDNDLGRSVEYSKFIPEINFVRLQLEKYENFVKQHPGKFTEKVGFENESSYISRQIDDLKKILASDKFSASQMNSRMNNLIRRLEHREYTMISSEDGNKKVSDTLSKIAIGPMAGEFSDRLSLRVDKDKCKTTYESFTMITPPVADSKAPIGHNKANGGK